MAGRLFIVKESFSGTGKDGVPFTVQVGKTIREGHPYLVGREIYAEPLERADFDIDEQATAPRRQRRNR